MYLNEMNVSNLQEDTLIKTYFNQMRIREHKGTRFLYLGLEVWHSSKSLGWVTR